MTGQKNAGSTYDQMMAELEIMDDDEEDQLRRAVPKLKPTTRSRQHEKPPSVQAVVGKNTERAEAKDTNSEQRPSRDDKEQDDDAKAQRRHTSFPSPSRRSSGRRSSKSRYTDHEDSDVEKEARVRHRNDDAFVGQTTDMANCIASLPVSGNRLDAGALRLLLTRGVKLGAPPMRCHVDRDRHGLNRMHPVYRLVLEDSKQFLTCARRRTGSKTSNYLLTLDRDPTDRHTALVIGKLRANWSGSEYIIFDDGLSPSKTAIDENVRNVLGIIEFAYDEMGPGRLNARIPAVQDNGIATAKWKDTGFEREGPIRSAFDQAVDKSALLLRNKRPQFDAKTGGHVLDFQGRVTMPSVKNFQLQSDAHGDATILQFGRVSCQPPGPRTQCKCHKDTFVLDVWHPLSPLQAFAVCLAVLDAKVADAKAFSSVARLLPKHFR